MKILLCPKCKSENVAEIFYGYPTDMDDFLKGVESGKLAAGGCCITEDDPKYVCNTCHNEFGNRFTTLEEL